MTDPEVLLGWLIAAYLAVACVVAVVASRTGFDIPAAARSTWGRIVPARSTGKPEWTLGPVAVLSLAYVAATAVVVLAWLPVRDLGLPNLVQFASTTASADVRHLAIATILGWSLLVVNVVVANQLVETLLPEELKKSILAKIQEEVDDLIRKAM